MLFTKPLVSYVAQDMLNILLCKNQEAHFCRHPPECFPVFKYEVFVPFLSYANLYFLGWNCNDEPRTSIKLKSFLKIWWSPPPQWFSSAHRIMFLYIWNLEEVLRNYKLAKIYLKRERALIQRLRHCCGSFFVSWSQTLHDQITQPLNLLSFCKMEIPEVHPCFHWGYSEHHLHKQNLKTGISVSAWI